MSVISDESEMDLEKCVQTFEEEKIELPEDSTGGKLMYFLAPYFFEKTWISDISLSLLGAFLSSPFVRLPYFSLRDYFDTELETKFLEVFSPVWMIVHYFLFFTVFFVNFIYHKKNVDIDTKVLQTLLKEVAEMDLIGDPIAWRRITSRVNLFSKETGYRYSLFYSGEHCMHFFVREIVKPIECQTYDIRCYYEGERYRNFWKNPSNKVLIERAVANYDKSVENFGKLSHTAEEDECRDGIFEKFRNILNTSMLYLGAIELALSITMTLVYFFLLIWHAILILFAAPC
ncbi:hypothetical protein ZYGR_0DO00100 [Zygosaccharomyces rouxii]|uniref:Uncharacterized protein n=1 Tax=Zygosaccharomyces rouxii TaxID=4956 RepID=A0A1Q3ALM5_ZYGRO|nr:hypothetical protein ZYGR_0DO00100 [Zygosaccharomyces rouxii]